MLIDACSSFSLPVRYSAFHLAWGGARSEQRCKNCVLKRGIAFRHRFAQTKLLPQRRIAFLCTFCEKKESASLACHVMHVRRERRLLCVCILYQLCFLGCDFTCILLRIGSHLGTHSCMLGKASLSFFTHPPRPGG